MKHEQPLDDLSAYKINKLPYALETKTILSNQDIYVFLSYYTTSKTNLHFLKHWVDCEWGECRHTGQPVVDEERFMLIPITTNQLHLWVHGKIGFHDLIKANLFVFIEDEQSGQIYKMPVEDIPSDYFPDTNWSPTQEKYVKGNPDFITFINNFKTV